MKYLIKMLAFSIVGLIVPLKGVIFNGCVIQNPLTGKLVIVCADGTASYHEGQFEKIQKDLKTFDSISKPGAVQLLLEFFPKEINETFQKIEKIKRILKSKVKERDKMDLYFSDDKVEAFYKGAVSLPLSKINLQNICVRSVDPRGEFRLCMKCFCLENGYMFLREQCRVMSGCEFSETLQKAQQNTREFLKSKESPLLKLLPGENENREKWVNDMPHKTIECIADHAITFIEEVRQKFKENKTFKLQSIFDDAGIEVKETRLNTIKEKMLNHNPDLCDCLCPMLAIRFLDCIYEKDAPQKTIVVAGWYNALQLKKYLIRLGWKVVYDTGVKLCPELQYDDLESFTKSPFSEIVSVDMILDNFDFLKD